MHSNWQSSIGRSTIKNIDCFNASDHRKALLGSSYVDFFR